MKDCKRGNPAWLWWFFMAAACSEPAAPNRSPGEAPADQRVTDAGRSVDAERIALAAIGKVVAMSLGEKSARYQVKNALRAAPFKEHKLELGRFLRSENGRRLIAASAGGTSPDGVLTLLQQVRPLEFYMPVRRHRENWVGDDEVLVAVQLEEDDPIRAFNARGEEIRLDPDTPPEQAVLSIVPVETSFDRPMPANSRNVGDRSGQSIGTLMPATLGASNYVAVEGEGGGGSGGGTSIPPGLYLEFSRILDVHEPFTKGEPEIEVHIHGPTDQGQPKVGNDLSCSGAEAYDSRKAFDQNGGFWEGKVMLFSADEITRYNSQFNDGFHVLFWEDDDTSCLLKLDNEALLELLKSAAAAFSTVAVKGLPFPGAAAVGVFLATLFSNPGEWLKTNDDFVGAAVQQEYAGYSYSGNSHVIMKGTSLNGRATIRTR